MGNIYADLKVLQTLEDVKATFKRQLEETPKCDGDYLKGLTTEEAANQYYENIMKEFPGTKMTYDDAFNTMIRKSEEFAKHAGEAQLFFMREVTDKETSPAGQQILCQIVKIWESEMGALVGAKYAGPVAQTSHLPRIIQHDIIDVNTVRIAR